MPVIDDRRLDLRAADIDSAAICHRGGSCQTPPASSETLRATACELNLCVLAAFLRRLLQVAASID
jgi:hypothetical protein